ncbi:MAG: DUF2283 domain-containing protein [Myxococcales bacterium]|nr:MAG: DUF2283 domain-containing protein [Myxococcales bacterium]
MRLTYDPKYNVAYISLRENRQDVETLRISDELNVDVAPDGIIVGIELLNATEQLGRDPASLIVVNAASGEEKEITFPS